MHGICKAYHQKCFVNNDDINPVLLQIRSMPMHVGLPCPATLLFNIPTKDMLPLINRDPININVVDVNYEALKAWQDKYLKDNDTHKDSLSFHIESIVTVLWEDDGPWMHGATVETNSTYHNGYSLLVPLVLLESPVLLLLWKFSASGTIKVQCLWHYKTFTVQILLANLSGFWDHLSG